jgi:hypothetical protein
MTTTSFAVNLLSVVLQELCVLRCDAMEMRRPPPPTFTLFTCFSDWTKSNHKPFLWGRGWQLLTRLAEQLLIMMLRLRRCTRNIMKMRGKEEQEEGQEL